MQADFNNLTSTSQLHPGQLGGVQHDILFSVMKIIHRQPENTVRPATASSDKVDRLSCCCRLSELMPLVRQLHHDARARYEAGRQNEQRQQAA
ncbi:hypothetical protein GCM10028824_19110 [Hymenobacter segetis]|uniref:Uncharacterized protein n=1 Tax=Hymenobacter segetis TaxID=2025509 RepID=A0ABU9M1H1_9BACT